MSTRLVPTVIASLACAFGVLAQVQMASLGNANSSHILPPSAYRFPSGEKLTYSVQWHMLNAGVVAILMQRSGSRAHLTSDLRTGKQKHSEFDIPACVSDVVSGFFYARSLPLQLGFSQVFPVNDGGKTTDVRINVEARENVKGPLGEFQTLRVKAEPISGPMAGKGEIWVWLTDDARRVPVQMKSKLGFAALMFQLQKLEDAASK